MGLQQYTLVGYKDLVLYFPIHIDEISNIAGFLVRVLAVAAEAHHSFQKVTSDLILRSAVGPRPARCDSNRWLLLGCSGHSGNALQIITLGFDALQQ